VISTASTPSMSASPFSHRHVHADTEPGGQLVAQLRRSTRTRRSSRARTDRPRRSCATCRPLLAPSSPRSTWVCSNGSPIARRAVPEPRRDEPRRLGARSTPLRPGPGERRHLLQVRPPQSSNRRLMRSHHLDADTAGSAEPPHDRHRLRRTERQIPPRHLPVLRPMQPLARDGGRHRRAPPADPPAEPALSRPSWCSRREPAARRLTLART
jgi:hypothetical protein